MDKVTLFYDSSCPLCLHEVRMLDKRNTSKKLQLVDIHNPDQFNRYHYIDKDRAMAILHAQNEQGEIVLGLDATHAAWSAVGLGYLSAPLRWPVIRYVADFFYRLFVSRRHVISRVLTGKASCESGRCTPIKKSEKL